MPNKVKCSLIIFLGIIFTIASTFVCYLLFYANFPINKDRFFRIIKNQPYFEIDKSGVDFYFNSNNLKLAGTLYGIPEKEVPKPCIIVLHGLTPYGRKLALYRTLGKKLADKGYLVFTINFRGFGNSQDPGLDGDVFAFRKDVDNAVNYVLSTTGVDSSRLYLIGHSLGGSVAFSFSTYDRRVKKIIAIGPSRRVQDLVLAPMQRKLDNGVKYIDAKELRLSREMGLSGKIETEILINSTENILIDAHQQYYMQKGHTPLFLIDGELEDYRDKEFLAEFFSNIRAGNTYQTFQNVSHYHNTINWDGGDLIVYDAKAVTELTERIDNWLKTNNHNEQQ